MNHIVQEMEHLRRQSKPFALATVITRNGSAPRSAGAKMMIKQDGKTIGTVGGGILEAQVKQLAGEVLKKHLASVISYQFSGNDAAAMDAICGGQVKVLVEWVDPDDLQTGLIIQDLHTSIQNHRKIWLVTALPDTNGTTTHTLIHLDGRVTGILPPGWPSDRVVDIHQPGLIEFEQHQAMVEPVNIEGTAYIFGAGHVSRSLAEFAKAVGFWTIVLDDRAEYANRERFSTVDELIVLDSFSDAIGKTQIDHDSFFEQNL